MGGFFREIVQERRLKKLEAAQAAVDDLQVAIEKNVPADILKNGRMKGDWLSKIHLVMDTSMWSDLLSS